MSTPTTFTVKATLQSMGNTGPITNLSYFLGIKIEGNREIKVPIPKCCLQSFDFSTPIEVTIRSLKK